MFDRIRVILVFMGWMVGAGLVCAAQPDNYQQPSEATQLTRNVVEMAVVNDTESLREQAFNQSLKSLLIATSGNPKIVNLSLIKQALLKPGVYVGQFNYFTKNVAGAKQALFLRISFNSKAIDKLLASCIFKDKQQPSSSSKPVTLIWLVNNTGTPKIMVEEGVDETLIAFLRKKTEEFGIPIILPTYDLTQDSMVKPQDLCKFNIDAIRDASKRYGTSTALVGCFKKSIIPSGWSSQWLLWTGSKGLTFNFAADSPQIILTKAIPAISSYLKTTSITTPKEQQKICMRITNVNGIEQYNEITKYLRGLNKVITEVDLTNINATSIELTISIKGNEEELITILNGQNKLVPNSQVAASPPGINLDYIWVVENNEKPKTISAQPVS
jgi:hypothetical protein